MLAPRDGSRRRTPAVTPAVAPAYVAPPDAGASPASQRLRALAALSGSLTDSLTPADAADLVERKALSALGATSAVVVTLGRFPPALDTPLDASGAATTLHVVHTIGLPADVAAALVELPLDAPVPLAEVARMGTPVFLGSEHALRTYPEWGRSMIGAGARAAAAVPVWANGELRGVLGLAWAEPRTFDEDERAFVITLGVMCAQAIMRAHLRSAERTARQAAETANQAKTTFLATISHELRTPMNAVIGYTELLADEVSGPVSALQREQLGRVRSSGRHLLGLIEDLLGYARLETGEELVRAQDVSLAELVEDSLVLVRPLADGKGLRIQVTGATGARLLHTDAQKVRQILVNLLGNAVKYTETGDVALDVGDGARDGGVVRFEVSDTGRGIAAEDHCRVFDPFWQEDPTLTRTSSGTGLGLSVARRLARLLGGDVVLVRSGPGDGSTFAAWLPARHVEHGPTASPAVVTLAEVGDAA